MLANPSNAKYFFPFTYTHYYFTNSIIRSSYCINDNLKPRRGAGIASAIKLDGRDFDSLSGELNIILLNSTRNVSKIGGMLGTQCLDTRFPLPTCVINMKIKNILYLVLANSCKRGWM